MPLYLIERNFAEQIEVDGEAVRAIEVINADENVRWLVSFLTGDKRKSYCLYEAEFPEAILAAARRANLPADVIIEVDRVDPALLR
jgi:Nickel responsive protein SCO4226-like